MIGGDERPSDVAIPIDYDPIVSYPLLMVLHGAGATGLAQVAFWGLLDYVDEKQFVMVFPDGTPNEGCGPSTMARTSHSSRPISRTWPPTGSSATPARPGSKPRATAWTRTSE